MMLLLFSLALLLSFYLIAQVTDEYFVPALDKISTRLKMSSDMAGATLMAIGSSAPELFISIIAVLQPENTEVGPGTIVGSAVFNILVIIGAAALVRKAVITWQPLIRDLIFYSLSIGALIYAFHDGVIQLSEAFLFIALYVIYVVAVVKWKKILPYEDEKVDMKLMAAEEAKDKAEKENPSLMKKIMKPFDFLINLIFPNEKHFFANFFISILIIGALCWVLVESAVEIAHILHIPPVIVALTVLAAGTSVPDMISSIIVAKQGRGGMAISNSIGSNIFDILIGLGLPWVLMIVFSGVKISVATDNLFSSVMLLSASVLIVFFVLLFNRWKIGKVTGIIFLAFYAAFLIWELIKAL